jgi:hypothetical protein
MSILIEAVFGALVGSIALAIPLMIYFIANGIAYPEQVLASLVFGPYGVIAALYCGALGGIVLCRHLRTIEGR